MAWADWWLAARAAQFSEIAYLPIPRTLYRFHATNMSLGAEGPAKLRELRKGLALQRWFLRRVTAEEMPVERARAVLGRVRARGRRGAGGGGDAVRGAGGA